MKPLIALLCLFALCLPCLAEGDACFSRPDAPYWHRDMDCRFAETGWLAEELPEEPETRLTTVSAAESEGQKPCPGCAADFRPAFSGKFPAWDSPLAPWGIDKGEMTEADGWPRGEAELPPEVLRAWGDAAGRLHELYPEATDPGTGKPIDPAYPDDYAGIFGNACGGYTLMLVEPDDESVARWRDRLGCEFWVISARYGLNELQALARSMERWFMDADHALRAGGGEAFYHISAVGVSAVSNAVEVGVVPEHFDEGVARMRRVLSDAGVDIAGRVRFGPASYAAWL